MVQFLSPPIAFGFANLVALGWLAAAAAPILIHLWMRQTRRETTWAAIRFLQAALERQARKLRLQHWILLAVRTLLLICIALAAAKPFFDSGPLAGSSAPTHWVLVIDASLSMNHSGGGESRLATAKRHASAILENSGATDRYTLCIMSSTVSSPLGIAVADRGAVLRAIERIEPTHAIADLTQAVAAVDRAIDSTLQGPSQSLRTEVVFFSDLGDNTWTVATSEGAAETLFANIQSANGASVVDVGAQPASNLAVTQLEIATASPTTGRPIEIRGEVSSSLTAESTEREVELFVDGLRTANVAVRMLPGQPAPVDFLHTFRDAGPHEVRLRGAEDSLLADNDAWLTLDLSPQIRVLCVEGARGAARYVADALDPGADATSPFEPVVISDADLATTNLDDFRCVLFCNVMAFGPSEIRRIEKYVHQGGGAVFFLGDRASRESYNELFAGTNRVRLGGWLQNGTPIRFVSNDDKTAPFVPIQVGEHAARSSYGLDPLDYAHPIVAPFQGRERSGLLTTPVSRSHELTLLSDDPTSAQVVLALEGGLPLVVAAPHGLGRLVVVGTDASLDSVDPATDQPWTALPAWPSFLPLLRGMVEHVAAGGAPQSLVVGQAFRGRLPGAWGAGTLAIERPDGQQETITSDENGEWSYKLTDRIGVYRALQEGGELIALAAANADPAESSLRRVALDALPDWLAVQEGSAIAASSQSSAANTSIHRLLIQLALILALVDTALASWFGRGHA